MTGAPVAGLLLAAGAGRRYGMPKALVERDGRSLTDRAVAVLRGGGLHPVVVVLGAVAEQVRAESDLAGCRVVVNPDWDSGMGSSLRTGLAALADTEVVAAVVLLVDMPGITAESVRRVGAVAGPQALAMAGYPARAGHPVLLGRAHWAGVRELATGDVGARAYLRSRRRDVVVVSCADVADDRDLDTPPPT